MYTPVLLFNETPIEKRGKHAKGNAVSADVFNLIRSHISLCPVKGTQYSGREYQYLDAKLNVKIMHEMFCTKYPDAKVNYYYYLKFFHENFNLHFGRPQVDTCNKCEELSLKIKSPSLGEAAKKAAIAEHIVHQRRAKKFYNAIQTATAECEENPELAAISFDFMQNLQLPLIPVQDLFYLTQLSVSVFGIHDLKTGTAYFYVYPDNIASKGPNEVASFLLDFIFLRQLSRAK